MIEPFKQISSDFDVLFFLPHDEDDKVHIEAARYGKKGKLVDNSEIGPTWHIILFKTDENGIKDKDVFEAIFSDPREYVSNLIPQDWYGFVAKKTTTSKKFVREAIDKIDKIY
jgi:hypothetical protein